MQAISNDFYASKRCTHHDEFDVIESDARLIDNMSNVITNAGCLYLRCSGSYFLHQLLVPGGSQSHMVREDGSSMYIVVTVDSIHAVDHGDLKAGLHGLGLICVGHVGPVRSAVPRGRKSASTAGGTKETWRIRV